MIKMNTILNTITSPADLKELDYPELCQLSAELRDVMINTVERTGGHLASSLGAVELTIALHRVFNSPDDRIIWDVGHQSYGHKLLTGRKDAFSTLRQYQGLSGFPERVESPHDAFGAGHAGTSISAALGIAMARDLAKDDYNVVAVIGDGSLGSGIALEAINHAGHVGAKLTIILNDNGMSISPSVGSLYQLLNRVRFSPEYESAKERFKSGIARFPFGSRMLNISRLVKDRFANALLPGSIWKDLGYTYLGPVDGHDLDDLMAAMRRARDYESRPVIIHVATVKGKGYEPAELNAVKYHGVSPMKKEKKPGPPNFGTIFSDTLIRLMRLNPRIVAITAAMLDGTGLTEAARQFPDRVFDVGICEQHAVTLAAGLATEGYIPVVAIYSTFLQRSYDQVINDVCLQDLPVVFAIDRAGIVGEDGKTHQGAFDISYMRSVPNMVVSAPMDENEFQSLLFTAVNAGRPISVRYPRGSGEGVSLSDHFQGVPIGRGEVLRNGDDISIIAIGSRVYPALAAADILYSEGIDCTVVNARFAKPLDEELIVEQARKTGRLVTVEENVVAGGFGSAVMELLQQKSRPESSVLCIGLPDQFIEHGQQDQIRSKFLLDAEGIAMRVKEHFTDLFLDVYEQKMENIS
jgi:1-deoxy-D-xylulose-5-phosphate synthase